MSAANDAAELVIAGETAEDSTPAISRQLFDDPVDPIGPPCVVQFSEETGQLVRIVTEADDDYDNEVALAEREQRERRDSVRKARVESAYVRGLIEEATAAAAAAKERPLGAPAPAHLLVTDFMNRPEPEWLVEGVLLMRSVLAIMYGEPNGGKSTVALDLLLALARGIKWHGRDVEQSAVAFLAAESVAGLQKRLRAYEKANHLDVKSLNEWFFPIPTGMNLSSDTDVEKLITYLKTLPTPHPLRVLAIDTLSQVTPGVNENTSDMGMPINACERIHRETGVIVLLIAHCGKDPERGIRGWSGILGALDTEIAVLWDRETDVRSVYIKKQRDGDPNVHLFDCMMKRVVYGIDKKGREVSSVVVDVVETQQQDSSMYQRAIRDVLAVAGRPMTYQDLVKAVKAQLPPPEEGKDRRGESIKRAYKRMVARRELLVSAEGLISSPFAPVPEQPIPTVDANAASPTDDLTGDVGGAT